MNVEQLMAKLLAAAQKNPPSETVPYAFEKRIMERLARPVADAWSLWGRALWRAAAACVLTVVLLGGWALQMDVAESTDLSQDFEETVLAALDEQPSVIEETW